MKKLFLILTAVLCFCAVNKATGQTFTSYHNEKIIYYKITSATTVEVTNANSYNNYNGIIVIPSTVTYNGSDYTVTAIGNSAFSGCTSVTSVTIPNLVTSIAERAFFSCNSLTSITIPDSVATIGNYAFSRCNSLTSVTIPNLVTIIGDCAFSWCFNLTSVTIGNSVTTIGENAFSDCNNLTSVTIPNSVTTIGNSAFFWCDNLTSVTIGNSVTTIGNRAFSKCSGLTSVTIGNSIITIGENAFSDCSGLTSVIIPNSVTTIGNSAFSWCDNLTSVTIGNSVTTIGNSAFSWCDNLTSVTIGNSVITIGNSAFFWCDNLTSVTIPNSVTTIGEYAFGSCSSLTSITIGNSVTTIGNSAFSKCSSLTSVIIPNSVTIIGESAFYKCSSLTSVTIGNSVTTIGIYAFTDCSSLTFIISNAETPPYSYLAFFSVPDGIPVHVPCASLSDYLSSPSWSMYLSNIRGTEVINYYEVQICNGATYSDSTFTGLTAEGTYYAPVYQSESGNGCDSVVALNISYYPVTDYTGFMCYNGSYSDGNFSNLTQTGIYSITLQSVQDCDSVVRLILDYYPAIPVTDYTGLMCRRGSYSDANFSDLTESGTYSVTLQSTVHGCDSVVRLTLSYYPDIPVTSYSGQMCRRGSYSDANFNNLAQAGTYYDTLQSVVHGCDSVVRLTLGYYPAIPVTDYTGLMCYSGSYSDANFSNLTQAGTYYDTLQSLVHGCDSVVRLTLDYTAPPPLPPSICMITVDEQNHNEIVWKRREDLVFYNIYREGMQSGQYDLLATTGYDDANLWTDTSSDAKIRSYRYKVSGIDTCGNESDLSDSHKTMHLTINSGLNGSWNLIWTAYEGADYSTYNIYRATGDTLGSLMLTGSMPAGNTSYSDFSAPAGYVYYVVEIMLDNPCDVSKSLGSIKSNIATNNPGTGLNACSSLDNGKLYPNPATDHINIVLPDNAAYALFTLYDMQGKALIHQEIGNRTEEISVSSLAAGMYIYNMVTDRQKYHGKLIVK